MKAPIQSLPKPFPEALQKDCLHGFGLPSFHWYVHLHLPPWLNLPSSLCPVQGPYGGLTSPHLPTHHLLRYTGPFAAFLWPSINAAAHFPGLHTPKLSSLLPRATGQKQNLSPFSNTQSLPSSPPWSRWALKALGFSQPSSPPPVVLFSPAGPLSTDVSISTGRPPTRSWLLSFPCSCLSNPWFWAIPLCPHPYPWQLPPVLLIPNTV